MDSAHHGLCEAYYQGRINVTFSYMLIIHHSHLNVNIKMNKKGGVILFHSAAFLFFCFMFWARVGLYTTVYITALKIAENHGKNKLMY